MSDIDNELLDQFTNVLVRVAAGDWTARAQRDFSGDASDVLAYMVNATVEEVSAMVAVIEQQRDELATARAQLLHAEKLAALGQLAGGVAHELNQPLTAIRLQVDLARLEMTAGKTSPDDAALQLFGDATDRMAAIVDAVRTFARRSDVRREKLDPQVPVLAALKLMRPLLEQHDIHLEEKLPTRVPAIHGDPDRLQQVLVNLIANARDALAATRRTPPGTVEVSLQHCDQTVLFTVSDDGIGVPEHVRERIFDPFFTTKDVGEGTGLGLSLSYAIVRDHDGTLDYEARDGGGARFVMSLPVWQS